MTQERQAVLLNAIPLLILAALYLIATVTLLPSFWRERTRMRDIEVSLALVYPAGGAATLIFGLIVLDERRPFGNVWVALAAILIAGAPVVVYFARWRDRGLLLTGSRRAKEAEELTTARERALDSVRTLGDAFARTYDVESVARLLLDEVGRLVQADWAGLALVTENGAFAEGALARCNGRDEEWWPDVRIDLENEPSAIASVIFEAAPVTMYDVASATNVPRGLAERVGAQSAAFMPLISRERVTGVLVIAAIEQRRAFTPEDVGLMRALAGEAALALDRARSSSALGEALARERLVAQIGRRVRSELNLDAVLQVAVDESAAALGVTRCFIRLEDAEEQPIAAEWNAPGTKPIGSAAALPVVNLAAREKTTIASDDVLSDPRLAEDALGSVGTLTELGTRAVLAVPIVIFNQLIGVLGLHRAEPGSWSANDIALAEAVAGEIAIAVHTTRLLAENDRRIEQQVALLQASAAVASELQLDPVLERLVAELGRLLAGDAADCYLLDRERDVLRCAAVEGLPAELVGFEFPAGKGAAAEAIRLGRAVIARDYAELDAPVPHPAYEGFADAIVAPVIWAGEVRGVLGVGSRSPRTFTEVETEALDVFAGLASLALRNAEAFADRSRQARIQRGFYRIASVLGRPISLEETFEAVAYAATEALGGTFAAVLMPRGAELELRSVRELPPALEEALRDGIATGDSALEAAAREDRIIAAPAVAADDRFEPAWRELAKSVGYSSLIAVPVHDERSGPIGGLVIVFFADARSFSDDDLELARHLADAARGALDRSGLYEAERTARSLAQQLSRTGSLLATELDPAAVLDEVVEQAPLLVGASACAIRVIEGDQLVVSAAGGRGADATVGSRSPATAWLSGDVAQSRLPLAVENAGGDERLLHADAMLGIGYAAFLGVPLVGPEGSLHGVLSVYAEEPRSWREDEIEALGALASNAAAALSNAELYQRVALDKERNDAILANIADGIVAVDRDGNVVLWNTAAELITGVPQEEALGRRPEQVLQRNLASDGAEIPGNRLVSVPRGGKEVWLSLTEAVMRDPAGAIAGRIFAFRDISSERFVEQMKSDFVSTVSQELRRPLTSIYGFAETLLRQDVMFAEEDRRTFLGYIASESERLTAIVDALLNVARLDTGDLQVNLAPTDIGTVVSEVVAGAEAGSENGHRFVLDLPQEPLAAEADPDKLRLVLGNLIDNAVKYSPEGGTVTVAARRRSDIVEVSVADEGIGIPSVEQDRIFRKFYRADSPQRRDGGGTGLGLFIAQGLVTAMGGRIWVTSTEGEGSSFTFELPAAAGGE